MPHNMPEVETELVGGRTGAPLPVLDDADPSCAAPPPAGAEPALDHTRATPRSFLRVFQPTLGFLTSFVVHLIVLLILALTVIKPTLREAIQLTAQSTLEKQPLENFELNAPAPAIASGDPIIGSSESLELTAAVPALELLSPGALTVNEPARDQPLTTPSHIETMLSPTNLPFGGGFEGRSAEMRARLAQLGGGTPASEQAVEMALNWLAAHQLQDGSWHFNHHDEETCLQCRHPGSASTTTGSTGLALLAFLGAGYHHQDGPYKEVVSSGLYYLTSRMLVTPHGGDLQEGTMYGHGIAALAICEAYAMTQDAALRPAAQQAVDFICYAQHPEGGWRYFPGQPGDTTVFGWQIMTLKSARLANIEYPSPVIENAMRYLDSVQDMNGSLYRYQDGMAKSPSPTAIGLLARMYYGWRRDDPRVSKGIFYLDAIGPSKTDMYFNYYATQVLHHYQGTYWTDWNEKLRDYLVANQARDGHERGSWFFNDQHGKVGGRVYTTAMCAMILEVYYRHMPLYDDPAVLTGF